MQQLAQLKSRCYSCKTQPRAGWDSQSQPKHIPESDSVRQGCSRTLTPSRGAVISRRLHMVASLNACAAHGQAHFRAYLGAQEQTAIKPSCTMGSVTARYTSSITVCPLNTTAAYSECKYTGYPANSETCSCVVTIFLNGCGFLSFLKKKQNRKNPKKQYLTAFLSTNAVKHFCTEGANLGIDLLLCWPTLVQLEYISPITNFKCCMQREGAKIMKMKHWVPPYQCCGSEHCPAETSYPAVMTTTSLLQLTPRGSNSALPKMTPPRAGQEAPHIHTHLTHCTLTLCRECWNPACKSKANSPCLRIHMLAENTKARRWPSFFQGFTAKSLPSSTIEQTPLVLSLS